MAYDMKKFFETRFGPTELAIIHSVFNEWTERANVKKDSPEAELAAAIVFNLFREGNDTVPLCGKPCPSTVDWTNCGTT